MFGLFGRSANKAIVERLYLAIVEASRAPVLYRSYGIPDTFEGRFESLTLHAALVLRRLQASERPGPDLAQHLVDTVFTHFDRTLREMGVGDTAVPKRMKTLAEAFLGRAAAYDAALTAAPPALAETLGRNVLASRGDPTPLAGYVEASVAALALVPLSGFVEGRIAFPLPEPVAA